MQRRASIDPNPAHPLPYAHSFRPSHTGLSGGSSPSKGASPSKSPIFSEDATGGKRLGCEPRGARKDVHWRCTCRPSEIPDKLIRHSLNSDSLYGISKRRTTRRATAAEAPHDLQTNYTEHGAPGPAPVKCYTTPSIALRGHTRSSVERCTGRSELRLEPSGPTAVRARRVRQGAPDTCP